MSTTTKKKSLERESVRDSGIVEIRLRDPKRTGTITVRGYNDPEGSGDYHEYYNPSGSPRILRIKKKIYLDLSKEADRLTYIQIKNHPIYTNGPNPCLVLYDNLSEAENYVTKKDLEADANVIIRNLQGDRLIAFARVLLADRRIVHKGNEDVIIKRSVYEMADDDPTHVINEWNDPDRAYKEMLWVGRKNGMFKLDTHGVWSLNGTSIGVSLDTAIDYLKDNPDQLPSIRRTLSLPEPENVEPVTK